MGSRLEVLQQNNRLDKVLANLEQAYRPKRPDNRSPFAGIRKVVGGGACNPR